MSTLKSYLFIAAALLGMTPVEASAANVPLEFSGWSYIGTLQSNGWTVVVNIPTATQTCSLYPLRQAAGGLNGPAQVDGTSSFDGIVAVTSRTVLCGTITLDPIILNGNTLTINGGFGDDILYGGFAASTVNGGADDDWSATDRPSGTATGGNGEDLVYSNTSSVTLRGNGGNDHVCALNANRTVLSMDGGTGTNSRCGTGTSQTLNFTSVNCTGC